MSRLQLMDGAITDMTKPQLVTLESLETQIAALTPRGWWDASNPAYRSDIGGTGAVVTGSISGTTFSVSAVAAGAVAVGQAINEASAGTYIVSGSGTTWTVNNSQTLASGTLNLLPTCSQVNDRSGNSFNLQQATQANRPPIGVNFWGALNSVRRDALTFNGTTDYKMASSGNVFDNTTVWTEIVILRSNQTALGCPISTAAGTGRIDIDAQAGGLAWRQNAQASPQVTAATSDVMVMSCTNYPGSGNVTGTLYVTDKGGVTSTASATYAVGSTLPGNAPLLLGTLGVAGGYPTKGAISEALIFKSDFSSNSAARSLFQQYYQMKYRTA